MKTNIASCLLRGKDFKKATIQARNSMSNMNNLMVVID